MQKITTNATPKIKIEFYPASEYGSEIGMLNLTYSEMETLYEVLNNTPRVEWDKNPYIKRFIDFVYEYFEVEDIDNCGFGIIFPDELLSSYADNIAETIYVSESDLPFDI